MSETSSLPVDFTPGDTPRKALLHEVIFKADTGPGKAFDVGLLVLILISVLVVMFETVSFDEPGGSKIKTWLYASEWVLTGIFTIEYALRIYCLKRPKRYAGSFFGVVDLLALLPTYLSVVITGSHALSVVRAFRLLRVFRIFEAGRFVHEANAMRMALWESRIKITVFLSVVFVIVTTSGACMYLCESGEDSGFTSMPQSMYWAIVTMTTVGYGDIAPVTLAGKMMASVIMVLGYSLIVVPTGIVSAEFVSSSHSHKSVSSNPKSAKSAQAGSVCSACQLEAHDKDALYCKACGAQLEVNPG